MSKTKMEETCDNIMETVAEKDDVTENVDQLKSSKDNTVSENVDQLKSSKDNTVPENGTTMKSSEDATVTANGTRRMVSEASTVTETDREGQSNTQTSLPIDRGWAWVILFASALEVFLYGGMLKSTGIFYVQYQQRFSSSASSTFLISTVQNIVVSIVGLIVMTVGLSKMSSRTCVMIGGIATFLAYVITAFAQNLQLLYLSVGFLGGVSMSMTYLPIVAMIGVYFDKYRGLANSITVSGASLGGLAFAPIITTLFDEYGFTGAMAIVAALTLNIVVAGALLRPLESYSDSEPALQSKEGQLLAEEANEDNSKAAIKLLRQTSMFSSGDTLPGLKDLDSVVVREITGAEEDRLGELNSSPSSSLFLRKGIGKKTHLTLMGRHNMLRMQSHDPTSSRPEPASPGLHFRKRAWSTGTRRNRTVSEMSAVSSVNSVINSICRSKVALYTNAEFVCGSLFDVRSCASTKFSKRSHDIGSIEITPIDDGEGSENTCGAACKTQTLRYLRILFDFSLLSNRVFLWFLLTAMCLFPGSILIPVCIAPHAQDAGLTNQQIGVVLSIIGCLDFFSRMAVGVIVDKKWLKGTTMMSVSALVIGILSHLLRFFTTFQTIVFYAVVAGCCCGVYMALYAVVLIEYMGLETFKSSLGFTALCHGVAAATYFPLIGVLRDSTGSYVAPFHLLGTVLFCGAILAAILPAMNNRNKHKKKTASTKKYAAVSNPIYKSSSKR